ncbi:MAG: methyltransferase domain-containing protein [Dehalococcoidia bacterium]
MSATVQDQWSKWLLGTRFGGDAKAAEEGMRLLRAVRDRVLHRAKLGPGMTLLDVGAGDGLIAFGALDRVGETGHVIFSDISKPLLDHDRDLAGRLGALDRCSFVEASAADLRAIPDASIDVVTTRSVLIYVPGKIAAFREFHRVLKPGGRVSLFEPINRYAAVADRASGWGGPRVEPVRDLAERIGDYYRALQPLDADPMMDFDERDLVRLCEEAGFNRVQLELRIDIDTALPRSWEAMINAPGNPRIPPMAQAMREIFSPEEAARFEKHLRPLVEAGGMTQRNAVAFLCATKDGGPPRVTENGDG